MLGAWLESVSVFRSAFVFVFFLVALCQTRCQLVRGILWAKQSALSLENSLHLQAEALSLAREKRVRFEALVFAKDLGICCPFAASSDPLLPAGPGVLL